MPRRMSKKDRAVLLEAVLARDGDVCMLCRELPVRDKTLDHLNGDHRDDRLDNLVVLCRACNSSEGNRARRGARLLTPATLGYYRGRAAETLSNTSGATDFPDRSGARVTLRERERDFGCTGVDRRGWGAAEEAANLIMEPTYRLWLYRWVKEKGSISRQDAIDAGAEHLDQTVGRASQQTVERYFRKAISSTGWLEERRDEAGQPVWGFRVGVSVENLQTMLESRVRSAAPRRPELERAGT